MIATSKARHYGSMAAWHYQFPTMGSNSPIRDFKILTITDSYCILYFTAFGNMVHLEVSVIPNGVLP
uniref:Uncharacterized protein n=1 Tax=Arundo donax TaxID=35708 RepID=A0A0A9ENS0_ARUDO